MIWLNVIRIIVRILFGLISTGFILSMCLHKKHKIFENIFEFTGFCAIMYGIMQMFMSAILGF